MENLSLNLKLSMKLYRMNTNSKSKDGFLLYKPFYEPTKHLSLEDKGRLYDAIFNYQLEGIEPEVTSPIRPYFLFFRNQFRLDDEKYKLFTEQQSEKGRKSAEAR